jgi:hypothetical protein
MIALLWLLLTILASPFKSKCQLEAETVALRHQVIVLRRCGRIYGMSLSVVSGPWVSGTSRQHPLRLGKMALQNG